MLKHAFLVATGLFCAEPLVAGTLEIVEDDVVVPLTSIEAQVAGPASDSGWLISNPEGAPVISGELDEAPEISGSISAAPVFSGNIIDTPDLTRDITVSESHSAAINDPGPLQQTIAVVPVPEPAPVAAPVVLPKPINKVAEALKQNKTIRFSDITFKVGEAKVTDESKRFVKVIADALIAIPSLKVEISGHTDSSGSREMNQRLSEDRAEAVRLSLIRDHGIASARLRAAGFGEDQPVATNETNVGRAKNRRVEVRKI